MSNEEIEKLEKRIKGLEWEIDNAHAFIFNITPRREVEDMTDDLCEQIELLEKRMKEETDRLAKFLKDNFGGTDRNESVCEAVIRLLSTYKKALIDVSIMKERG